MKHKRFQECNWLEKIWRYRWYICIPFMWIWHQYIKPFFVIDDHTNEKEQVKGKMLWKLLIGIVQTKMHWYYTWEEVKESLRKKTGIDFDEDDLSNDTEY